jgi:hypothetical protein
MPYKTRILNEKNKKQKKERSLSKERSHTIKIIIKKIYRFKNEKNHYLFFVLDTGRSENVAKLQKYFSETF